MSASNKLQERVLMVGRSPDNRQVVINHPQLVTDENGVGHIVFSPKQARALAAVLTKNADLCDLHGPAH